MPAIYQRHAFRQSPTAEAFHKAVTNVTRREWFHNFNTPPLAVGCHMVEAVSRSTLTRWENGIHKLCADLTGGVYKVAVKLAKLFNAQARGWAWPSRRCLAEFCGVSISTVARALKILKDKGLLYIDSGQKMWRKSRYFPLFGFRSCVKADTPHLPKDPDEEKTAGDRPLRGGPGQSEPEQDYVYLRELRREEVRARLREAVARLKQTT